MNNLYFVRLVSTMPAAYYGQWNVTFLFTAKDEAEAERLALDSINPQYLTEYKVDKVEFVCQTPNTVHAFEPV